MIKGKTEDGFEFELAENIREDYEVVEALVRYFRKMSYENFVTFKELMFRGAEECEKRARDFLRERDGFVSTKAMTKLVFDIWNGSADTKKS